jgi:hypothetical protein
MNKGFLIVGGIIFAIYIYFTFWNIFQSNKKQKEDHYPDLTKSEIFDEYNKANKDNTDKKST